MFGYKGARLFTPSRGGLDQIMKKLYTIYTECGGDNEDKFGNNNNIANELDGLSPFDALKIIIAKKLKICRKAIKLLEIIKDKSALTRKKNEVRKMIRFISIDYERMKEIHENYIIPKRFRRKKPDAKLIGCQEEDLDLIQRHINEVRALFKRRYEKRRSDKTRKKNRKLIDENSDEEEDSIEYLDNVGVLEEELKLDPTVSSLPRIDVTQAMAHIKKNKKSLKSGLQKLNTNLLNLRHQALSIGDNINEGNIYAEEVEFKVDRETESLKNLNVVTEKAKEKLSGTTRLCCCICLLVIIIICVIIMYIIFVSVGIIPRF